MVDDSSVSERYIPNVIDKTVWALARIDEVSRPSIYVTKMFIAIGLTYNVLICYGFLVVNNIINRTAIDWFPFPSWVAVLSILALCYIPIHLTSHSAAEIEKIHLSRPERWIYTAFGLFILPVSEIIGTILLGVSDGAIFLGTS